MRVRYPVLALTLVIAGPVSAYASIVRAQADKPADAAQDGKARFEAGQRHYSNGDYELAIREFQAAYDAAKMPAALQLMAESQAKLGRIESAIATFEKLLSAHADVLSEADVASVQKRVSELRAQLATVDLQVGEKGVDVLLDGKLVGKTPLTAPIRLSPGSHTLLLKKEGFEPLERTFVAESGKTLAFNLSLRALPATAYFEIRERTGMPLRVLLDEKDVGPAPWKGDITVGAHTVQLVGPTHATEKRTITTVAGGRSELVLDARPVVVAVVKRKARIVTKVGDASIRIAGAEVGKGVWEGELPLGEHNVDVVAPGYQTFTGKLIVLETGEPKLDVALVLDPKSKDGKDSKEDNSGIYLSAELAALFALAGKPSLCPEPSAANQTCDETPIPGIVAAARFGYNFSWIGVEAVGAFMLHLNYTGVQYSSPNADDGLSAVTDATPRSEKTFMYSLNGLVGVGPRVTFGKSFRFTAGLTPGISFRKWNVNRTTAEVPMLVDSVSVSAGTTTFGMLFDAGIHIGSLKLGLMMWLDTAGVVKTDANPTNSITFSATLPGVGTQSTTRLYPVKQYTVSSGTNFFLGPVLGFRFGM